MQIVTLQRKKEFKENTVIDSRIRICICCGNSQVDLYEFGVSCENCGTSLYFGRYSK